ncbi:hypothetical protein JCM15579A_22620 [Marinifilum fragile]
MSVNNLSALSLCVYKHLRGIKIKIMITFKIDTEYIELIKLLKATRVSESGAQAKIFVEDGIVLRNGEVETRKRAKIRPGDKIEIFDEVIIVE